MDNTPIYRNIFDIMNLQNKLYNIINKIGLKKIKVVVK